MSVDRPIAPLGESSVERVNNPKQADRKVVAPGSRLMVIKDGPPRRWKEWYRCR